MKKCILYGAASIGNLAKKSLEKCGFEILGYIDKRAFEMSSYNELPVWGLDNVPTEYVNSNTIIYIAVKNVFEHERIVLDLAERGFSSIVYKPYNVLIGIGSAEEERISAIYDKLFEGKFKENFNTSDLHIRKENILHDYGMVHRDSDMITAYIPVEFIFTNNYKVPVSKWENVCVAALFTHIDFFRFLENHQDAGPDAYLQEYCMLSAKQQGKIQITDAWKDNVIENRIQVYEQMKEALDLDADFFIRNAAEAEWNSEKKYFNLVSGKHRCTFLASVGKKYIPLKMKASDYDQFVNSTEINEMMSLLIREKKEVIIPHPYFYRGMFSRDRSEWAFFLWFARYYGKKLYYEYGKADFTKLSITDYSNDYGNFARFAKRMGCDVHRMKKPETLESQLNKLFHSVDIYASGVSYEEEVNRVAVICADEIDSMDVTNYNCIIVKYGTESRVRQFAEEYGFEIITTINSKYQQGDVLYSYLLESKSH